MWLWQVWLMGREHANAMLSMYTDWLAPRPSPCSRLTRAGPTPARDADFLQVRAAALSSPTRMAPAPVANEGPIVLTLTPLALLSVGALSRPHWLSPGAKR